MCNFMFLYLLNIIFETMSKKYIPFPLIFYFGRTVCLYSFDKHNYILSKQLFLFVKITKIFGSNDIGGKNEKI